MDGSNLQTSRVVRHLCTIVEAGERGYAVAAANVNNRGLKLLFKTYARQRADFKNELIHELSAVAADIKIAGSFPAMIHRGRMNIFAALTIGEQGREHVVLKEVLVGERAALKAYETALRSPVLADIKEIVQRQYASLRKVVDEVELLRGIDGRQMVVRLYDSDADAARAAKALKQAHFDASSIERVPVEKATELYSIGAAK